MDKTDRHAINKVVDKATAKKLDSADKAREGKTKARGSLGNAMTRRPRAQ